MTNRMQRLIASIPKSACLVADVSGIMQKPDAWTHGKRIEYKHYTAQESAGFRSQYQPRPVEYFAVWVDGELSQACRASGANIPKMREGIARLAEFVKLACPSCLGSGGIGHCNRCNASGFVAAHAAER